MVWCLGEKPQNSQVRSTQEATRKGLVGGNGNVCKNQLKYSNALLFLRTLYFFPSTNSTFTLFPTLPNIIWTLLALPYRYNQLPSTVIFPLQYHPPKNYVTWIHSSYKYMWQLDVKGELVSPHWTAPVLAVLVKVATLRRHCPDTQLVAGFHWLQVHLMPHPQPGGLVPSGCRSSASRAIGP